MDVKKMLAVGTAIVGTVAMADIVSSSVVGYLGNDMKASGFDMASGSFASVSASNGSCTLADFSVSGYDAPVWDDDEGEWVDGCGAGDFVVQFLTSSGTVGSKYCWIDNGEQTAGWYNTNGSAIEGGAASVTIPAGQAMWIRGRGMKLTSAGAVNEEDIVFLTRASGFDAVGNATPVNLTLAKLTVSGYDAPVWDDDEGEWVDGCGAGDFVVQFLTSSGTVESKYGWIDNGEQAAGWYNTNGSAIEGGANSVSIPAGLGLWVRGRGMSLRVPAPELN